MTGDELDGDESMAWAEIAEIMGPRTREDESGKKHVS